MKSSPTCANYGLQQRGQDNKIEFLEASFTIDLNFYMDDLVKSVDTPQEAIECYRQLVETLKRSELTLKKLASNCPEVTGNIRLENRLEANEVMLNAEPTSLSILGLEWKIDQDCLQVCRGPNKECPWEITQGVVLSFVSSIFDPMGIFAPFTMRMRMLLKIIWIHHGQSWDERLNEEDNVKRSQYRMARILELYPGKDGVVRSALIKTLDGTLKRPMVTLAPLFNERFPSENGAGIVGASNIFRV